MTVAFNHCNQQIAQMLAETQLGPAIAVAASDPRVALGELWPVEEAAILHAVSARKLEFQAGRFAARQAMEDLGVGRAPIPLGPDRAPIWPAGLTGSISHCDTVCIAAVARTSNFLTIGVDVEQATALDATLLDIVCNVSERDWLAMQPSDQAPMLAKLIFSAKECAYKAQYTLSRRILDFHRFSLELNLDEATFSAQFCGDVAPFPCGFRLNGRFGIAADLIVATVVLRPGEIVTAPQDPAR